MKYQLQECCCGSSLRTGSLIILWFYLVVYFRVATLTSTAIFLVVLSTTNNRQMNHTLIIFFIITSFIGSICSLAGLVTLHMNRKYFLIAVYQHMHWTIAFGFFFSAACVFFPSAVFPRMFESVEYFNNGYDRKEVYIVREEMPVGVGLFILLCATAGMGLLGYSALVIKSYRNFMVANHAFVELPSTQEPCRPCTPIAVQCSEFPATQSFKGPPKQPLLPPYTELSTQPSAPFINN